MAQIVKRKNKNGSTYLDSFSARVPNREHLTNTGASTYSPSAFLRFSLTATVNPATARPLAVARISTSRVRLPSMMTRLIAMSESNLLGCDYLPFRHYQYSKLHRQYN